MERGIIEHPGSVLIVPLQERDGRSELLMLRQYRAALEETILELPAGTRGWGEDWLICAQRELREETGFRADSLMPLGKIWLAPGLSNELMTIFLATGLHPDPLPQDMDEEIEVTPLSLVEALDMAQDGRIQDAKSVVAIFRTAAYLNESGS